MHSDYLYLFRLFIFIPLWNLEKSTLSDELHGNNLSFHKKESTFFKDKIVVKIDTIISFTQIKFCINMEFL